MRESGEVALRTGEQIRSLTQRGVAAEAGQLLIAEGAQHGIACTLRAIAERGDTVLADAIKRVA